MTSPDATSRGFMTSAMRSSSDRSRPANSGTSRMKACRSVCLATESTLVGRVGSAGAGYTPVVRLLRRHSPAAAVAALAVVVLGACDDDDTPPGGSPPTLY